ncbi:hypothetical protein K461DRAFT_1309 [Myriangium duriaei CBS 260.36]|uniref:Uncharacterized protein n=1 Tax=Myriangium duriaei CBS 260.36 TaxID=1168546 RepID=A0A9P4JD10_9PEZI|nr:hypothetical protein K461DRAFT_1309 [Myriangium duriaei CBS 260.36]
MGVLSKTRAASARLSPSSKCASWSLSMYHSASRLVLYAFCGLCHQFDYAPAFPQPESHHILLQIRDLQGFYSLTSSKCMTIHEKLIRCSAVSHNVLSSLTECAWVPGRPSPALRVRVLCGRWRGSAAARVIQCYVIVLTRHLQHPNFSRNCRIPQNKAKVRSPRGFAKCMYICDTLEGSFSPVLPSLGCCDRNLTFPSRLGLSITSPTPVHVMRPTLRNRRRRPQVIPSASSCALPIQENKCATVREY